MRWFHAFMIINHHLTLSVLGIPSFFLTIYQVLERSRNFGDSSYVNRVTAKSAMLMIVIQESRIVRLNLHAFQKPRNTECHDGQDAGQG